MSKTVAVMVIKHAKYLAWLGHMPLMNWSFTELKETRGIDRIVCVAQKKLCDRVRKLLGDEDVDVLALPRELEEANEDTLDKWLTSAGGPAAEANIVVVSKGSSPFLGSGRIEACLTQVRCNRCTYAQPSREVIVAGVKKTKAAESVESVRVFRVNVPKEQRTVRAVKVSMIESLDVENPDQFVLADALVAADKI